MRLRTQEFQPLCRQLSIEKVDTRCVAARPGEAGDKTNPDWVFGVDEDDGAACLDFFDQCFGQEFADHFRRP
jgi:hypothetical protein